MVCEATGCVTATDVTNHFEPHKNDMMPFWNSEQWQPACKWHNDLVKQPLELMLARGELSPEARACTHDCADRRKIGWMHLG
jgi:5-methylcytosine-specific restriction protein A